MWFQGQKWDSGILVILFRGKNLEFQGAIFIKIFDKKFLYII